MARKCKLLGFRALVRAFALGASLAALAGAGLVAGPASAATLGAWSATAPLVTARTEATTTVLANGQVLVAGGKTVTNGAVGATATAELYNPATGRFTATGSMPIAVGDATAALLADGEVLVVGGDTPANGALTPTGAAELYDPATGSWSSVAPLPAKLAVFGAVSVRLANGLVLVAGGARVVRNATSATADVELYHPASRSWTRASGMPGAGVVDAVAAQLANGDVLVAGGENELLNGARSTTSSSAVYSVARGRWTSTPPMPLAVQWASAARLANGDVLVAGGSTTTAGTPTPAAELFDPATATWATTGSLPGAGSYGAEAVPLPSGYVLYLGGLVDPGQSSTGATATYSPVTGTWQATGALGTARAFASVAVLPGGYVLAAGGETGASSVTSAAELYLAGLPPSITSAATATFAAGAYGAFTVTTAGAPAPAVTVSGSLPAGVTLARGANGTATLAGVPAASSVGHYSVTLTASDSVGAPATQVLSVVVLERRTAGYWYVTSSGSVEHQGAARPFSSPSRPAPSAVVAIVPTPDAGGYYLAGAAGGVYNYGDAGFFGSKAHALLSGRPVVAMAASPDARGYYLVTSAGNVFVFGDARFYGSPVHAHLASRVVAFATTPDGRGYWVATASGEVLGYGDATPRAAPAIAHVSGRVVAIAASPTGPGCYLATSSGSVYGVGGARPLGAPAPHGRLAGSVTGFAVTADGAGYYLVTSRGSVYNSASAPFFGSSAHASLPSPVTGFAPADVVG